jgi:signal transduction histidine kinase
MVDPRAPRRRAFPVVVGGMLIVLAATSLWGLLSVRSEMYVQVHTQLEAQLQDRVANWEDGIIGSLDEWREAAAVDPTEAWAAERRIHQKKPWFDALYIWQPARIQRVGREQHVVGGRFLFPLEPPIQRIITEHPCLSAPIASAGPIPAAIARVALCDAAPAPVRLYASTEVATHLQRLAELPGVDREALLKAAIVVLERGVDPKTVTLRDGISELGVDPIVLAAARTQRADVMEALGDHSGSIDAHYALGIEITELDAPEYRRLLLYVGHIVTALKDRKDTARTSRLEAAIAQADRRVRAYLEIRDRVLKRPPSQASEDARFIRDQYSETPFLLYLGPVQSADVGAAIQVDQSALVRDFLTVNKRWRDTLLVVDLSGKVLGGVHDGGPPAVETTFSRTLSHLRVGLTQAAIDERLAKLAPQWLIPAGVVVLCFAAGIVALRYQIEADRQLQALLVRQRDFTARVTHELKTPLAGIKIMAENLEAGRYRDASQARQMALSILQEADRLAARVNEILNVAKERKIPDPVPFDPEEVALEAIETWGPRLKRAGVELNADLDAAEPVLGDGDAMRDALGCLLDNALKYRREDRHDSQVWLTLRQDGDRVLYEVKDNGLGVPPDEREAIFERFVRVEGPNRGTAGGHGLGLAQVREVVEQHEGSVYCQDGEDGGAMFVVSLPAVREVA